MLIFRICMMLFGLSVLNESLKCIIDMTRINEHLGAGFGAVIALFLIVYSIMGKPNEY